MNDKDEKNKEVAEAPAKKMYRIKAEDFDVQYKMMDGTDAVYVYLKEGSKQKFEPVTMKRVLQRVYNTPLIAPELMDSDIIDFMDSSVEFADCIKEGRDFVFSEYVLKEFFERSMEDRLNVFVMNQFRKQIKEEN